MSDYKYNMNYYPKLIYGKTILDNPLHTKTILLEFSCEIDIYDYLCLIPNLKYFKNK
jgi:hypothetical protein